MPKMSGVEAAKVIKFKYPKTNILILSGFENEKYVTQILRLGAGGYVVKNVAKAELADAIRTVAEGKKIYQSERFPYHGGRAPQETFGRTSGPLKNT